MRRSKDKVIPADALTLRVAWLALSEEDNEGTRFLTYINALSNLPVDPEDGYRTA